MKLDETKLEELRTLKNETSRHQAKAGLLDAQLKSEVVDLLIEAGVPVDTGAVCLDCGTVRRDSRLACECAKNRSA